MRRSPPELRESTPLERSPQGGRSNQGVAVISSNRNPRQRGIDAEAQLCIRQTPARAGQEGKEGSQGARARSCEGAARDAAGRPAGTAEGIASQRRARPKEWRRALDGQNSGNTVGQD